ncbi:MAG TPA: cytochrome C assembly family protein [Candidatus Hypogeohydataceae bacterium YC41]
MEIPVVSEANLSAYSPFWLIAVFYLFSGIWEVGHLFKPEGFRKQWVDLLPFTAFILHSLFVIYLAYRVQNIPVTNLFESVVFLTWCVVAVFNGVEYLYGVPSLGAFLFPLVTVLSFWVLSLGNNVFNAPHNLSKFWLIAHTIPLFMGYAAFAITFTLSLMYLTQQRQLKHKLFGPLLLGLPSLESLDRLIWKTLSFGFPLLTLGLVFGAFWVKHSNMLGPQWYLDPKVVMGTVTWLVYAGLLHLRIGVAMHGSRAALLNIAGFSLVLFTFLGTFFIGAQHGYKKVSKEEPVIIKRIAE